MLQFSAHQAAMLLTVIVMVTSTTQATIFEAPQQVHLFQAVSSLSKLGSETWDNLLIKMTTIRGLRLTF